MYSLFVKISKIKNSGAKLKKTKLYEFSLYKCQSCPGTMVRRPPLTLKKNLSYRLLGLGTFTLCLAMGTALRRGSFPKCKAGLGLSLGRLGPLFW
jgi:hypothetical protein